MAILLITVIIQSNAFARIANEVENMATTETITWYEVEEDLPPDYVMVLCRIVINNEAWIIFGWRRQGIWLGTASEVIENVTHWAKRPRGPTS
jgi:hypothetical protein